MARQGLFPDKLLPGKVPTPLEVVDVVADVASQVFSTPARVAGNVLGAGAQMARNLESDLARPREHSEIPPPPDVLVEPVISGVSHIVEGVVGMAKGAFDGVVESAKGIRREADTFMRR